MESFDCWNGVNGEVLRRVKLREEKIKFCPIPKEYDVVNVALSGPSCSRTTPYNLQSTSKRDATRQYYHSCNFTNIQKYTNVTKKRQKMSKNKPFARTKTHCPLRVAELSVPTKRHCLETWRNNIDVLPSFMIERLRQIVMDEKPIVKIYDAIDSFKKQKTRRSRSPKRHVQSKQVDQLKLVCALLSYKIIHKLLRPLNLTLNSQLKKLSRIVDDEITNILKSSKKSKVHSNCKIQTDIADKITVWIASVVKDSAYMLLLEDFQELREEEGPVWDLIDELIDNVVIICEPMSIVTSIATELSVSSISKSTINEELRIVDEANEIKYDEFISNPSDTTQIHNEDSIIAHILDNIVYDTQSPSMKSVADSIDNVDSVNSVENLTNSNGYLHEEKGSNGYLNTSNTSSVHEQPLPEIDSQINDSHENENDSRNARDNGEVIQLNVNVPDLEESMLKIKGSNREMEHYIDMTSKGKKIESTGSQIDLQHEETPDDSIKKVKFSNLNIGVNARKTSVSIDSSLLTRKFSKDESLKSELQIAPPNDHLLSAVDESWPENLQFPILKATISVSKSVLSLGKILESEEKQLTSVEKDTTLDHRTDLLFESIQADINKEVEKVKNVNMRNTEKNSQGSCNDNDNKHYKENNAPVFTPPFVDVLQKDLLEKGETTQTENSITNLTIKHMPVIDIRPNDFKNKITHEKEIQTEQEALKNIYGQILSTGDFLTYHFNQEYKGICSSANFSEVNNRKEIKIRKWCQGLENVMQNLELWTDWVEKTCNCIILLKYTGDKKHLATKIKEESNPWTKLKNNIESDSKTWRQVSKGLKRGITNYRNYYVKHKVRRFL